MNKEEDYDSDSDQSDEDFCPEKAQTAGDSDGLTDEESEVSEEEGTEKASNTKTKSKRGRKKSTAGKAKRARKRHEEDEEEEEDDEEDDDEYNEDEEEDNDNEGAKKLEQSSRRSTRQNENSGGKSTSKSNLEKDELESDEEEKSRMDALWADFLSDMNPSSAKKPTLPPATTQSKPASSSSTKTSAAVAANGSPKNAKVQESDAPKEPAPQKITVTEVVDFAGEEVRVEKIVNADSIKENKIKSPAIGKMGIKRSACGSSGSGSGSGGLGSILNQIGKKKKLSVLEKTKLDWNSFKQDEGIEEELQTFNKGKDGFLERQDFLERTDLRQFEIEKNMRMSRRNV